MHIHFVSLVLRSKIVIDVIRTTEMIAACESLASGRSWQLFSLTVQIVRLVNFVHSDEPAREAREVDVRSFREFARRASVSEGALTTLL